MKPLLHICCAPCSISCIAQMREEGLAPTGFWHNENIHPYTEYRMRKNTLVDYAKTIDLPLILEGDYGLRPFVRAVAHDIENRCGYCYAVRLDETARYAAEHGFDAFCTTLTVSPYQNTSMIFATGERLGAKYGVKFAPYDFSPHYREGQTQARELGLYMQKYCGCVFSEEDRYCKNRKTGPAPRKEETV